MKLFGIIALAILNVACFVSAAPRQKTDNGEFVFYITSGTGSNEHENKADIYGLSSKNKYATDITIPPYFEIQNQRYYTKTIMSGAFSNSSIETVTFKSGSDMIYVEDSAFSNCKNLKTIKIYTPNLMVENDSFSGCNPIEFDGWATRSLIQRLAEKLVKEWNLPVNDSSYERAIEENADKKMKDLYTLAKYIRKNFKNDNENTKYGMNLASVLIFRKVSNRGIHMLFRELALAMGINEYSMNTAGDGRDNFWSFVRFYCGNKKYAWYNADLYYFNFDKNGDNYDRFFQTNYQFENYLKANLGSKYSSSVDQYPSKWLIYETRYGFPYDNAYVDKADLFDDFLAKKFKNPETRL